MKGLLEKRRGGKWGTTQENCWATLAIDRYFAVFEKEKPNFRTTIWTDNQFCAEFDTKGTIHLELTLTLE